MALTDSIPNNAEATALTLISQYGEDAAIIAVMRAAEVAAIGDAEALAHWDAVIAFIEDGPPAERLN